MSSILATPSALRSRLYFFLACLFATIPICYLRRLIPTRLGRHAYSALSGALHSYIYYGFRANLHFLALMLLGYASMVLFRRRCGIITFVLSFGYLTSCHVYYMRGDPWRNGRNDFTGSLMILTLKVISCAVNYSDGALGEQGLREAQKRHRLLKLPSLVEYLGFCLNCGTLFAGPVYEMKDYLDWTEEKGIWSSRDGWPSPLAAAAKALAQAVLYLVLYIYLSPYFPLTRFMRVRYQQWGLWKKLGFHYMASVVGRCLFYFQWVAAEAALIASGLGFSGWTDTGASPRKPRWDRARNVDVVRFELVNSAALAPRYWNVHVSTWLRHYVYERLARKGAKPGLLHLLATQTICALWHGVNPGYFITLVQMGLMFAGSRVIYRWQRAMPQTAKAAKFLGVMNFTYTVVVFNYVCVSYLLLDLDDILAVCSSVYYIGSILPVLLLLVGKVIKPGKAVSS
uniref:1-acylglycerophosphocholine O-acyltransferase n=1 Tax=Kalanchoe fedtschenkoi TaxID=63787 RepID=A0A7N0TQ11_KALFE